MHPLNPDTGHLTTPDPFPSSSAGNHVNSDAVHRYLDTSNNPAIEQQSLFQRHTKPFQMDSYQFAQEDYEPMGPEFGLNGTPPPPRPISFSDMSLQRPTSFNDMPPPRPNSLNGTPPPVPPKVPPRRQNSLKRSPISTPVKSRPSTPTGRPSTPTGSLHQTSIHPNYNGSIQPHNFHNGLHNGLHNGFNLPEETQLAGHPGTHSNSFQERMLEIHQNVLELMKERNEPGQFLQALKIDRKRFAENQQLLNHLITSYPALGPVLNRCSPGRIIIQGLQSAGKTSLFAALTGLKTDIKGDTASTKQPIVYTFVNSDHFNATIQDGNDPETKRSYKSTESLNRALNASQAKISEKLSLKELFVKIEGPQFIDMTIVDFPGDVPGDEEDQALREKLYNLFHHPDNIILRVGKGDGDPNNDFRLQLLLKNLDQKFKFAILTHIGSALTKQRQIAKHEGAKPMFSTGFLNPQMPMFGVECSIDNVEAICNVEGDEREAVWEKLDTDLREKIDNELTETIKKTGIQKLKYIPGCFGIRTLQGLLEYIQSHIQQETLNHLASEMLPDAIHSELIISDRAIKDAKSIELAYLNLFKKHFSYSALDNALKKGYDIMEDKFEHEVKTSVFGPALLLPSLLDGRTDKENLSLLRAMEKMHEGLDDKEFNNQCNQHLIDTVTKSLGKLINIFNVVIPEQSVTPTKFAPSESDIAVNVPSVVQVIERKKHAEVVSIAHDHINEFFNAYFSRLYSDKELLADLERAGFSREECYQVFRKIQTGFSRFTKEEFVVLKAKLPRIDGGVYTAEYTKLEKKYQNLFAALGIRQNSDKNQPNLTKSSWKNLRPHDKRQLKKWAVILAGGALTITTTAALSAITGPVAPMAATAIVGGGVAAHKAHKKHSAKKALKEAAIEGGNAAGKAALSAATSGTAGSVLAATAPVAKHLASSPAAAPILTAAAPGLLPVVTAVGVASKVAPHVANVAAPLAVAAGDVIAKKGHKVASKGLFKKSEKKSEKASKKEKVNDQFSVEKKVHNTRQELEELGNAFQNKLSTHVPPKELVTLFSKTEFEIQSMYFHTGRNGVEDFVNSAKTWLEQEFMKVLSDLHVNHSQYHKKYPDTPAGRNDSACIRHDQLTKARNHLLRQKPKPKSLF